MFCSVQVRGGRVGFVPLHVPERPTPIHDPLLNIEGVVGRADSFVKASPEFRWLAPRLLGRTWIVEQLDVALDLKPDNPSDIRFVTLAGELLEPDGTLMVGPRLHATGLISRRSELRALREQIEQLEPDVRDFEPHLALVSGTDGASDTEKIIAQTPNHLAAGGWLILETSPMLASRFEQQLKSSEAFDEVKVDIDLSRQPRILSARRK